MKDPLEFKKCSNLLHTCHISKHWLLDQQGTIAHHLSNSDSSLEKKCFLQVWIKLLQIQLLITWFHEIRFPNFHTVFTNEIVYWYLFIFMKPNETNIDWLFNKNGYFFFRETMRWTAKMFPFTFSCNTRSNADIKIFRVIV